MLQQIVRVIQDQAVLDRAAEPIQGRVHKAFRATSGPGRALKDFLSGTWIGHPLHPILKDLPIGGWTMAAIFDALPGEVSMQRAADISLAVGVAGALASAVTGLADWSDTTGRARRIGVVHAVLNVSAAGFYAASLAARIAQRRRTGVQFAFAGYAVMLLGAYLGGHLVFAEQIGVNHAAQSSLPTDFLAVLAESDLHENEPKRVWYNALPVVLVRRGGRIDALYERCAHLGGPLSEGTVENGSIRCPWHGSRFALEDGRVLEGPATSPQPCFETRVSNGNVEIRARETESP
jgi:nitrite reductase/ring-hydroxylating ferredoxin subunit/uncharacterized membrane protein